MKRIGMSWILPAAIVLAVVSATAVAPAGEGVAGAVYTMTNAVDGNEVVVFDRMADGSLRYSDRYATGGLGSGDGLGNQGGVVLSDDGRWLLVVNAGSGDVSVFRVRAHGLALTDTTDSGGLRPVSVDIHRDLVYVVNAGGTVGDMDGIAALELGADGSLTLLPASTRPLSVPNAAPAQIRLSPDGEFVLVSEKATSIIDAFPVAADGYPGVAVENPAAGMTPFAIDLGRRGQVFVSEVFGGAADSGSVSSYALGPDGHLEVIDGSVPNFETAPCWLVVTKGGRYAITTNTPDDSLSTYVIGFDGHLELLDADGRTAEPGEGTRPLDMDLSNDGRFLYTLNIGTDTISTFRVMPDGSLEHVGMVEGVPGANGLAAR